MALPWVRLDTSLPDNPKILALVDGNKEGRATAFVYISSLAYSGKHELAGFVPKEALSRIHGRSADATRLEQIGLWVRAAGGWNINGWAEFQLATPDAEERKKRAQLAAAARWSKRDGTP
jgi:hypothetical protein